MSLNKSDFYFGALISRLMNTGSIPAIIEDGEKRSIYSISNDHGTFEMYAKYRAKSDSTTKDKRWDFKFSADEIAEIKRIVPRDEIKYIFCFICGVEGLAKSEIAFLTYEELRKAIGKNYTTPTRRVSIAVGNGSWNYQVYGTGLERVEQAIKVTRNIDKRLIEIGFMKAIG